MESQVLTDPMVDPDNNLETVLGKNYSRFQEFEKNNE